MQEFFSTAHLESDLKRRSVRGGVITLAANLVRGGLYVGGVVVLARLLLPEDFGLVAMVTALTGFVMRFKDLGLAAATIQRDQIDHAQISTLFWINVAFGLLAAVLVIAASPAIAWFFDEQRLISITVWLALGLFLAGLTVQHQAILRRQMQFATLAWIDVAAMGLAVSAALLVARHDENAGYWSLVVLQLTLATASLIGVWLTCRWRPSLPVRRCGVGSMLSFGSHLTAFNVLNYAVRNVDKILIGWKFGAGPLGLYDKAYEMLMFPINQINTPLSNVVVPTLSRLQNKPDAYRSTYVKCIFLIAGLGMPIVSFMIVAAENFVRVLLGEQWIGVVPLFHCLSVAAFLGTINVATGWVYVSLGQTARQLKWNVFASAMIVIAMIVGLRWGPTGVAIAFSLAMLANSVPAILYCFRETPLQFQLVVEAIWRPLLASLLGMAVTATFQVWAPRQPSPFMSLLADLAVFSITTLLAGLALPGGRRTLITYTALLRELRSIPLQTDDLSHSN